MYQIFFPELGFIDEIFMGWNLYVFSIVISFILGYILSQYHKPSSSFNSILAIIAAIVNIFNSHTYPQSEMSPNHKFFNIFTYVGNDSNCQNFYVPTIETRNIISVKGIRDKTEEEETAGDDFVDDNSHTEDIPIGKHGNFYYGLDISPQILKFDKFEITVKPFIGHSAPQISMCNQGTIYQHFMENSYLLKDFSTVRNIHRQIGVIDEGSSDQE